MEGRPQTVSGRRTMVWAAALGAVTVAMLVWLGLTAPSVACGSTATAPAMAFQVARTPADLAAIFGSGPSACRDTLVDGLRLGGWVDLLLFIPVYGAFLASVMMGLQAKGRRLSLFLIAVLAVTVAGDAIETAAQIYILGDVDAGARGLALLGAGNMAKTAGLSLVLFGLALALWSSTTALGRITAVSLALIALVRMAGFLVTPLQVLAPLSALAAFVVLWGFALNRAIHLHRSGASVTLRGSGAPPVSPRRSDVPTGPSLTD